MPQGTFLFRVLGRVDVSPSATSLRRPSEKETGRMLMRRLYRRFSGSVDFGSIGKKPYIRTVHLGCPKVEFFRSNCMDSRVGIQLPCAITMVLPKGILMKVPYGRARDHRVHHLHHHQHHLGRGPFWVLPICRSISSTVSTALETRPFSRDRE